MLAKNLEWMPRRLTALCHLKTIAHILSKMQRRNFSVSTSQKEFYPTSSEKGANEQKTAEQILWLS